MDILETVAAWDLKVMHMFFGNDQGVRLLEHVHYSTTSL